MTLYTLHPFDMLVQGNFFGSIYEMWNMILGQSMIFQIALAGIMVMIWIKTRNLVAAGISGLFMSLAMVSWPGSVEYLGPEGQFLISLTLIFSVFMILAKIALSRR